MAELETTDCTLTLPTHLWKLAKMHAVEKNTTLRKIVTAALEAHLRNVTVTVPTVTVHVSRAAGARLAARAKKAAVLRKVK